MPELAPRFTRCARWLGYLALSACASVPAARPNGSFAPASAGKDAPSFRLPAWAHPLKYEAHLDLDPEKEDFSGRIRIAVRLSRPSAVLWLHARDLAVAEAAVEIGAEGGGERLPLVARSVGRDLLRLSSAHVLPAGDLILVLGYRGKIQLHDGDGPYRVREDGRHYIFTQFEAIDARQAFPCFDEPGFKTPWQLSIRAPADLVVLSNTLPLSERPESDGRKTVQFAPTLPLPSYLVAFAVGPFDLVAAGSSKSGTPLRIVVPKGRAAEARYAARVTGPILDRLEAEIGFAQPYPKQDSVAVPVFNAGAMENAGLITYLKRVLLVRPDESTRDFERTYAEIAAHELAHQWFGNLVTMAWWDDLWLNESFATWMANKVIAAWKPEWKLDVARVRARSQAMEQDALRAARRIREPVTTSHDIENAFDGITYQKGASVLAMFEHWLGPDRFRAGIQAYLQKNAQSGATYRQFVQAMSGALGQDLEGPFASFILQAGVPLVSASVTCAADRAPTVQLGQRRYRPLGSKADLDRHWQVPVCVRFGLGGKTAEACALLTEARGELPLPAPAGACPDWVLPNQGGWGYYRMLPDAHLLAGLVEQAWPTLSLPERVVLLQDADALVESGDLGPEWVLSLAERLGADAGPEVLRASMGLVLGVDELLPTDLLPAYRRFLRDLYGGRARALGWRSRPGEDDDTKELRARLLRLVAGEGMDAELGAEARALSRAWLSDRRAIEPELVSAVLEVAAGSADGPLFEVLAAAAKKESDRQDRRRLLEALSRVRDPGLVERALVLGQGDTFEPREARVLLFTPFRQRVTRARGLSFWKAHFDRLTRRLPTGMQAGMLSPLAALCDEKSRAEISAYFTPRARALEGGPRTLNKVLEQVELCAELRRVQGPEAAAFFRRRPVVAARGPARP